MQKFAKNLLNVVLKAYYTTYASNTPSVSPALPLSCRYNEVSLYNFNSPGWNSAAGHFTQVVWKSTTLLGCAVATCSSGLRGQGFSWAKGTLVVCRYSPAGNVIGQFATNVLRKTSAPPPATQPPAVPPSTPPSTPPASPPPPTQPPPTSQPPAQIPAGTLPAGYKFLSPGCLYSANTRFRMCMQADGRVVLIDAGRFLVPSQQPRSTVIWTTGAAATPRPPYKLTMQADGNLVGEMHSCSCHNPTSTSVLTASQSWQPVLRDPLPVLLLLFGQYVLS